MLRQKVRGTVSTQMTCNHRRDISFSAAGGGGGGSGWRSAVFF